MSDLHVWEQYLDGLSRAAIASLRDGLLTVQFTRDDVETLTAVLALHVSRVDRNTAMPRLVREERTRHARRLLQQMKRLLGESS